MARHATAGAGGVRLVFSMVSRCTHLFPLGHDLVALYAPDDAPEEEVLLVAQEFYRDVELVAAV